MLTDRLTADMLDIEVRNAVLRAWCHPSTEHIEPDPVLVAAIVSEVNHYVRVRLHRTHQPLPPEVEAAVTAVPFDDPQEGSPDDAGKDAGRARRPAQQQAFPKSDFRSQQQHGGF